MRLYGEAVLWDGVSDCIGELEARLTSLHEATLALDYARADEGGEAAFDQALDLLSARLAIPHEVHRISEMMGVFRRAGILRWPPESGDAARERVGTHLREIGSATVLLSSKPETLDAHWFAAEMQALSASLRSLLHTLRVDGFEACFTAAPLDTDG